MKKVLLILSLVLILFSCNNTTETKTLENGDQVRIADSISKQQQKIVKCFVRTIIEENQEYKILNHPLTGIEPEAAIQGLSPGRGADFAEIAQ